MPIATHKKCCSKKVSWLHNCDLAWENRAYVYVKFHNVIGLWIFITVLKHILSIKPLILLQQTTGNLIQLLELVYLIQKLIIESCEGMYFVHMSSAFSCRVTICIFHVKVSSWSTFMKNESSFPQSFWLNMVSAG